jgi:hypothetical protein
MPHHTKEKSADGGAGKSGAGRTKGAAAAAEGGDSKRGAGGRAIGKAALQARRKNAKAVADFLALVEGVGDHEEMESAIEREGLRLARVVKMTGCGHMDVQLQDGRTLNLRIAKSVAFKGRAANKSDRENCFLADDVIVVRDAMAAGKVPAALYKELATEFARIGAAVPKGFFTVGAVDAYGGGGAGWEFDREGAAERAAACIRGDARAVKESKRDSDSGSDGEGAARGGAGAASGGEEEDFSVDAI